MVMILLLLIHPEVKPINHDVVLLLVAVWYCMVLNCIVRIVLYDMYVLRLPGYVSQVE